jgi:TP901 family phage tail tape measure protein
MARTFQTDVILRLIDRLTGPLGLAAKRIERSNIGIERSFRRLSTVGSRAAFGMAGLTAGLVAMEKLGRKAVEISRLRNELAAANVQYEKDKTTGKMTLTGLTPEEEGKLAQLAIQNSRIYNRGVEEYLKAANELSRAGIPKNVLLAQDPVNWGNVATGIVSMAASLNKIDTGEMAERIASIRTIFNMPTNTAAQVKSTFETIGDTLQYFETQAPGRGKHLLDTLKFAGPIMAQTGMSFREITEHAIGLAKSYQLGSEAGVAFRSMMVGMIKPTKGAREELAKLGLKHSTYVKSVQTTGKDIGAILQSTVGADAFDPKKHMAALDKIAGIKDQIKRKLELEKFVKSEIPAALGLDPEAISEAINDAMSLASMKVDLGKFFKDYRAKGGTQQGLTRIFEGRQISRSSTFMKEVLDAYERMKNPIEGLMKAAFDKTNRGLDGAVKQFESAFSRVAAQFEKSAGGKLLESTIRSLADAISYLGNAFENASPSMQRFVTIMTGLLAIGAVTAGIIAMGKAITGLGRLAAGAGLASATAAAAGGAAGGLAAGAAGGAAGAATGAGGAAAAGAATGWAAKAWAGTRFLIRKSILGLVAVETANLVSSQIGADKLAAPTALKTGQDYLKKMEAEKGGTGFGGSGVGFKSKAMSDAAKAAENYATSTGTALTAEKALTATQGAVQTWGGIVSSVMSTITQGVTGAAGSFGSLIGKINETGTAIQSLQQKSQGLGAAIRAASAAGAAASSAVGAAAGAAGPSKASLTVDIKTDANANVASVRGRGALANTRVATKYRGRIMDEIATA